ncbi:hypothetical protein B0T20DRAFT_495305 [Sordaria brevicollis]|uniref:Uncharacterized protein n=1 Tax=Sordaria brevicollis TaxID=83679 RepID=A0AAE0PJ92_SORBR|nr:hypothetical protein B0T20DRAFT_495305 [Sordaria brevicollis]
MWQVGGRRIDVGGKKAPWDLRLRELRNVPSTAGSSNLASAAHAGVFVQAIWQGGKKVPRKRVHGQLWCDIGTRSADCAHRHRSHWQAVAGALIHPTSDAIVRGTAAASGLSLPVSEHKSPQPGKIRKRAGTIAAASGVPVSWAYRRAGRSNLNIIGISYPENEHGHTTPQPAWIVFELARNLANSGGGFVALPPIGLSTLFMLPRRAGPELLVSGLELASKHRSSIEVVTWKGAKPYIRRHQNSCDIFALESASVPLRNYFPVPGNTAERSPPFDFARSKFACRVLASGPTLTPHGRPAQPWWHKRDLWALNGWIASSSNASIRRPPHIIPAQYPGCHVGVSWNLRFRGVSCFPTQCMSCTTAIRVVQFGGP